VFTEGYDDPELECIVNARPTKSRALYAQIVGRGTRPLAGIVDAASDKMQLRDYQAEAVWSIMRNLSVPGYEKPLQMHVDRAGERREAIAKSGKPNCLVLDFTGAAGRHKLVGAADLLGEEYTQQERTLARRKAEAGEQKDVLLALEESRVELQQAMADWQSFRLRKTLVTQDLLPAELFKPSRADPATPKQKAVLLRMGFDPDAVANMTKGQAGYHMGRVFRK
jgi:superfamily II DNA or RNA helicase